MAIAGSLRKIYDPGLVLVLLLSLFNAIPLASNPGFPDGLRWLAFVGLLACAGGMYLFCRRRSGCLGAGIAALVYVYSPYLMHTLPYARGAYPELLALALFPLLLWRVDALRDRPSGASFVAVFALEAALISADYLSSLIFTLIVVAWLTVETAVQRFNREAGQVDTRSGALALAALLLGIVGPATFWLPALLESDSVMREEFTAVPLSDSDRRFVRLDELLSAPPVQDASAIMIPRDFRLLGAAQWLAALIGGVRALQLYIVGYRTRHPQTFLGAAFYALLALAMIFLMMPAAASLWEGLRPLQLLQFPARFLGPTAACLAIVASTNGFWLERLEARYRIGIIALAVALPIVVAFPLLFLPEWRHASMEPSAGALHLAELARRGTGAPFSDEFIPRDAHSLAAHALSAFSVALLCIIVWRLRNREPTVKPYSTVPSLVNASRYGILLGGGIALLAFAITFREGIAWLKSPPGVALPAQVRRADSFDGGLQLLGYDLGSERLRAGDSLSVNVYWYALEEDVPHYSSFLQLSSGGSPRVQLEMPPASPRDFSESWRRRGYILQRYELPLPRDLPAGDYDLAIGIFSCERKPSADCGKGPLSVVRDEKGDVIGDRIGLASIIVEAR